MYCQQVWQFYIVQKTKQDHLFSLNIKKRGIIKGDANEESSCH
jgi:hypothetical protein